MRFMIHGADQKTGREMTIVMEAPDASQAERKALYNDILVSSVARFTTGVAGPAPLAPAPTPVRRDDRPALQYQPVELAPEQRGANPPLPAATVPGYLDVLRGARWLGGIGLLARCGGGIAVLAGAALLVIALADPVRKQLALPPHPALYLLAAAVVSALGLLCILCGVMVSMTSGLVVAVRDIAQNTFHVAARPAAPGPTDPPPAPARRVLRAEAAERPTLIVRPASSPVRLLESRDCDLPAAGVASGGVPSPLPAY